jgi:hypothetical protein
MEGMYGDSDSVPTSTSRSTQKPKIKFYRESGDPNPRLTDISSGLLEREIKERNNLRHCLNFVRPIILGGSVVNVKITTYGMKTVTAVERYMEDLFTKHKEYIRDITFVNNIEFKIMSVPVDPKLYDRFIYAIISLLHVHYSFTSSNNLTTPLKLKFIVEANINRSLKSFSTLDLRVGMCVANSSTYVREAILDGSHVNVKIVPTCPIDNKTSILDQYISNLVVKYYDYIPKRPEKIDDQIHFIITNIPTSGPNYTKFIHVVLSLKGMEYIFTCI